MPLAVVVGTAQDSAKDTLAILQTLTVDEKFKLRLQELIAETEKANAAIAALQSAEKDSTERVRVAQALSQSLELANRQAKAQMEEEKKKLAAGQQDLARREAELAVALQEHAKRTQADNDDLDARRSSADQRQSVLAKREAEVKSRIEELITAFDAQLSRTLLHTQVVTRTIEAQRAEITKIK